MTWPARTAQRKRRPRRSWSRWKREIAAWMSETRSDDPLLQIADVFTTHIGEGQLFVLQCAKKAVRPDRDFVMRAMRPKRPRHCEERKRRSNPEFVL